MMAMAVQAAARGMREERRSSAADASGVRAVSAAGPWVLVAPQVLSCISSTVQAATMPTLSRNTNSTHAATRTDARSRAISRGGEVRMAAAAYLTALELHNFILLCTPHRVQEDMRLRGAANKSRA